MEKMYKINIALDFIKSDLSKFVCLIMSQLYLFYYFFVDKFSVIKIIKILLINDTLDGGGHL